MASPNPHHDANHELLSQEMKPLTDATLTIRVIKSFPFRTCKNLVLRDLDLTAMTVGELMERCKKEIQTQVGFKLYRKAELDTLKKYTVAHGHKTQNLIINLDHDDWILDDPSATLQSVGCENEAELSLFNRADYEAFKANPEIKWD